MLFFFIYSINCFYLLTNLFFHKVLIDIKHALVKTPKLDHLGHFYNGGILIMQVKKMDFVILLHDFNPSYSNTTP